MNQDQTPTSQEQQNNQREVGKLIHKDTPLALQPSGHSTALSAGNPLLVSESSVESASADPTVSLKHVSPGHENGVICDIVADDQMDHSQQTVVPDPTMNQISNLAIRDGARAITEIPLPTPEEFAKALVTQHNGVGFLITLDGDGNPVDSASVNPQMRNSKVLNNNLSGGVVAGSTVFHGGKTLTQKTREQAMREHINDRIVVHTYPENWSGAGNPTLFPVGQRDLPEVLKQPDPSVKLHCTNEGAKLIPRELFIDTSRWASEVGTDISAIKVVRVMVPTGDSRAYVAFAKQLLDQGIEPGVVLTVSAADSGLNASEEALYKGWVNRFLRSITSPIGGDNNGNIGEQKLKEVKFAGDAKVLPKNFSRGEVSAFTNQQEVTDPTPTGVCSSLGEFIVARFKNGGESITPNRKSNVLENLHKAIASSDQAMDMAVHDGNAVFGEGRMILRRATAGELFNAWTSAVDSFSVQAIIGRKGDDGRYIFNKEAQVYKTHEEILYRLMALKEARPEFVYGAFIGMRQVLYNEAQVSESMVNAVKVAARKKHQELPRGDAGGDAAGFSKQMDAPVAGSYDIAVEAMKPSHIGSRKELDEKIHGKGSVWPNPVVQKIDKVGTYLEPMSVADLRTYIRENPVSHALTYELRQWFAAGKRIPESGMPLMVNDINGRFLVQFHGESHPVIFDTAIQVSMAIYDFLNAVGVRIQPVQVGVKPQQRQASAKQRPAVKAGEPSAKKVKAKPVDNWTTSPVLDGNGKQVAVAHIGPEFVLSEKPMPLNPITVLNELAKWNSTYVEHFPGEVRRDMPKSYETQPSGSCVVHYHGVASRVFKNTESALITIDRYNKNFPAKLAKAIAKKGE